MTKKKATDTNPTAATAEVEEVTKAVLATVDRLDLKRHVEASGEGEGARPRPPLGLSRVSDIEPWIHAIGEAHLVVVAMARRLAQLEKQVAILARGSTADAETALRCASEEAAEIKKILPDAKGDLRDVIEELYERLRLDGFDAVIWDERLIDAGYRRLRANEIPF